MTIFEQKHTGFFCLLRRVFKTFKSVLTIKVISLSCSCSINLLLTGLVTLHYKGHPKIGKASSACYYIHP